ncbi:MAG: AAA family ATPase [Owenweeksia sp.]|nr:AAA family ATPase [Owenweeksia sp.]
MRPWPDIYQQDAERREDLASQQTIHNALAETYHSFDYQVIEVPKLNIGQRARHILKELGMA